MESAFSGEVTPEEQEANMRRASAMARQRGSFRFLTDLSAMQRGLTPGKLLEAIEHLDALGLPRSLREALILPAGSMTAADVRFYEDACQNRGWNMRIFPDRASALAWLRGG